MTGIKDTREQRRAEKNLVDTRIMRSFGETPGKREALLNKLVKLQETPVKREETPEKGEEPRFIPYINIWEIPGKNMRMGSTLFLSMQKWTIILKLQS